MTLNVEYREPVDRYFRLRDLPEDDSGEGASIVRDVFAAEPPLAFMLLDPAVAGHAHDPNHILQSVGALPPEIAGIDIHRSLRRLAEALLATEPAPERR